MLPDGSFGIAATQVTETLGLQPANGHSSRDIKALLGKEFQPAKVATELNPNKSVVLTLEQFALVCVKLTAKGNKLAERLLEIHASASFTSIVSSAFGVKFTQEQVVQWVAARETHKKGFHPLFTRWLKSDGIECTEYGREVNRLKECTGLPKVNIEEYSEDELKRLNTSELVYDRLRSNGLSHSDALNLL
jgi:hypothetical protein